jgi:uncharacterized membrane protein
MEVMGLRLGSQPTPERMTQFFDVAHYVSPRIFMPSAILTLVSGLALVFMGGAIFRDAWIIIALVGVALTVFLGATQIGPRVARISALLSSGGDSAEVARIAKQLQLVTRIDLLILVVVLLDMVLKPQF